MERDRFLLLINLCVVLLVLVVIVAVKLAPIFSLSLLMICAVASIYIMTENWITHDAVEFENRYIKNGFYIEFSKLNYCKILDHHGIFAR